MENVPQHVANSVTATVHFNLPDKPPEYGHGVVVRFAVAPKIGDLIDVDQYSIRKIPREELHQTKWQVVDVRHDLNLDHELAEHTEFPLATLRVTVHPAE